MKKILVIFAAVVLLLIGLYVVGSGFVKNSSVYVADYEVSEDGTEMTLHLYVMSSVGFLRKVSVYQEYGGRLYLDCYSAFGGVNGSIGAKSVFTVPLSADTEMIALYRNTDCYQTVLQKDENGIWQRAE